MGAVSVSFLGRCSAAAVVTIPLAITSVLGFAPVVRAQGAITDEAVDDAIRQAVRWIKEQRKPEGHWELSNTGTDDRWAGTTALALLALLYAGEDPRADLMSDSLTWLAAQKLSGTYVVGTRAHVLALVPGRKYTAELKGDLQWLLDTVYQRGSDCPGCYTYHPQPKDVKSGSWDNSNSQFGVLGVWMAAEAGLEVPAWYWEIVAEHWITCQTKEGGWGYRQNDAPTGSMTAAGLAALFVALDQRYADRPQEAGGLISAINAGLTWLAHNYSADNPGGEAQWRYYYLYGVERAGRASGRKYFRDKDWFREGAGRDDRYNYLYAQDELEDWVQRIKDLGRKSSKVFVIMNNHYQGQAVANALQIRNLLTGEKLEIPHLLLKRFPVLEDIVKRLQSGQMDLFKKDGKP